MIAHVIAFGVSESLYKPNREMDVTQENDSFQSEGFTEPGGTIDLRKMSVVPGQILPSVDAVEFIRQFHDLRSQGQFDQLAQLCRDAVLNCPNSPTLACLLADAVQCFDSEDDSNTLFAMKEYQRALSLDPLFGESMLQIGLILDICDNPAAGVAFRIGADLTNTVRADMFLAEWKSENGDPNGAQEVLANCLDGLELARSEVIHLRQRIAREA